MNYLKIEIYFKEFSVSQSNKSTSVFWSSFVRGGLIVVAKIPNAFKEKISEIIGAAKICKINFYKKNEGYKLVLALKDIDYSDLIHMLSMVLDSDDEMASFLFSILESFGTNVAPEELNKVIADVLPNLPRSILERVHEKAMEKNLNIRIEKIKAFSRPRK